MTVIVLDSHVDGSKGGDASGKNNSGLVGVVIA